VLSETAFNYTLCELDKNNKWDMPIVGQIFFVDVVFFRRGMTEQALN